MPCNVIYRTLKKCHEHCRAQSRSEIWVGVGHRPQSLIGPLYRRGCEAPGCRLEVGGDWACILLGLTSHCLLWSQQNGPLGPHLRRQAAGINPAADWASLSRLLVSGREKKGEALSSVTPIEFKGGVIYWIHELSTSSWLYIRGMQV